MSRQIFNRNIAERQAREFLARQLNNYDNDLARRAIRMKMLQWQGQTRKTRIGSTIAIRSGLRVLEKGLKLFER